MTYKGKISKKYKLFIMIPCGCECGELINSFDRKGRPRKFKKGHNQKGNNHHNWGGGRKKDSKGYWHIWKPNHPFADTKHYVEEHRSVYEHYLKILFDEDIYIPTIYEIHHINKNTEDNSLINLELLIKSDHTKIHHPIIDKSDRFCNICGGKTQDTKQPNGTYIEHWYGDEINGWQCAKCYRKILHRKSKYKLMSIQ